MRKIILLLSIFISSVSLVSESPLAEIEKTDNYVYGVVSLFGPEKLSSIKSNSSFISEKVSSFEIENEVWLEHEITQKFATVWYIHNRKTPEKGFITKILVRTNNFSLPSGLNIGTSSAEVKKMLGNPNEASKEKMYYCGVTECVSFFLSSSGTVSSIEVYVYTG